MADCTPVATPADGVLSRFKDQEGRRDKDNMSMVGLLLYAAYAVDIAYTVQALGRHLQAFGPEHWNAAKRVMRHLKNTRELGICFSTPEGSAGSELVNYCDTDWGVDPDTPVDDGLRVLGDLRECELGQQAPSYGGALVCGG